MSKVLNPWGLHEACTTPSRKKATEKGGRFEIDEYVKDVHTLTKQEVMDKWGYSKSTIESDKSKSLPRYKAICEAEDEEKLQGEQVTPSQ